MKNIKKENKLPKDILDQINREVEVAIEEEMKLLESDLETMNFSDMESQVVMIRAKIGEIFMQKIVEAKLELSKKKAQN